MRASYSISAIIEGVPLWTESSLTNRIQVYVLSRTITKSNYQSSAITFDSLLDLTCLAQMKQGAVSRP